MSAAHEARVLILTDTLGAGAGWARYSNSLTAALRELGSIVGVAAGRNGVDAKLASLRLPSILSYRRIAFLGWWYAIRFWFPRRRELAHYDVIHCFIETYAPIALALSRLMRRPYVLTAHGSFGLKVLDTKTPFAGLQRRAYRKAALVICVSEYVQQEFASRVGLTALVVIPNGVDASRFVEVPNHPRDKDLLITVSSLKPRKGIHLLIEALPRVVQAIPHLRYVIAAGPDNPAYAEALTARVHELGLDERVTFLGRAPDIEVGALYRKARAFALTSVSTPHDFEGFGLVYLEANAAGVPVVGMRGSGAEEAIKDGVSGFLARESDVADIANKIIAVMTDDTLHARLVDGGRAWAAEHLWARIAEQYRERYREVLHHA